MAKSRSAWCLVVALCLLAPVASTLAAITVDGVTDKKVYADKVMLTVRSEAGYDYTAELNGEPIAVGVAVTVNQPEYYELSVQRRKQSSGAEDSAFIRFIIRSSERANSEWGLRPWTPYPPIDSAAAEFAGARLVIVAPAQYPTGLEIPVIARVENAAGSRVGVNGVIRATGFANYPLRLLRGVGSVFLPAVDKPGTVSYAAAIHSLATPKDIVIAEPSTWRAASGNLTASVNWGENARVRVSGLTVGADATLTIGAGSVVVVDPKADIVVNGHIVVNGTPDKPVVFTTDDRTKPWGGFVFDKSTSRGEFTGTIFTGSGEDPDWFDNNPDHGHSHRNEQPLLFVGGGARVTATDCYIVENTGQAGHGESGYLTMKRCLVQKCISTGQYNGGAAVFEDCALVEFPAADAPFEDDDNDGLYLTGGAHSLTNCLLGWALDDGIDAGSGSNGSVTIKGCWIESTYHEGTAWSEQGTRSATDTVTINCGQGIECGFGSPKVTIAHCLSTANLIGARFGDNYDWSYNGTLKIRDSLLLFNQRDIWGRAWDSWDLHLSQMDIQDSYVSVSDDDFPKNDLWDPQAHSAQAAELLPFLPCPADTVGVGFAMWSDAVDLSSLSKGIPVRLSTFTTQVVSVDYSIDAAKKQLAAGTLHFTPGETVKLIAFELPAGQDLCQVHVTLSSPVNAELTGYTRLRHDGMCGEIVPLVIEGDVWLYFKGTQEPPADWNALVFDDGAWLTGATPIGYENGTGYEKRLATKLSDMRNKYISVYARRTFVVDDPSKLTGLFLTVDVDDGYIAYLNGVRVAALGAPASPKYDQAASANREACCGTSTPTGPCPPAQIDLSKYLKDLVPGENVLAIQAHNTTLSSSDFVFIPLLSAVFAE